MLGMSLLAACGSEQAADADLIIYNAQHEQLIDEVAAAFEQETGLDVALRNGSDLELANQLVTEGGASPADVFLAENSPAMSLVQGEGLFAPLEAATLESIPEQYRPDDDSWTGFAARSTVLVYNPSMISESELPGSLMDLADPQWSGRVSFGPSGADFQAIVAGVLALQGPEATRAWLEGLAANATIYDNNVATMEAVNAGQTATGVIFHYYWYRDQQESGANSSNTELHYFGNQDPGAFLSVSGAGVLANAPHAENAQRFLAYLTGVEGQRIIADSYALEYTLNPDAPLGRQVPPLDELDPPMVDVSELDSRAVIDLMQETGFL